MLILPSKSQVTATQFYVSISQVSQIRERDVSTGGASSKFANVSLPFISGETKLSIKTIQKRIGRTVMIFLSYYINGHRRTVLPSQHRRYAFIPYAKATGEC